MTRRNIKNKVQLNGQAKLNFDTGSSIYHVTIAKVGNDGINNADSLIDNVLHFGVMRHGKQRMKEIFNEKLSHYGPEYETQGIFPDEE